MTVARWTGGFLRRNPSRSPRPVWLRLLRHTVRIDSSCAHVSTCGPHSKLCATIRGPPCKQGATSMTLHVFSFVAQQLSKIKLPSAFGKLTLRPPFRTPASSFSWLHPSINFTMFCSEKLIFPLNWDIHGRRLQCLPLWSSF